MALFEVYIGDGVKAVTTAGTRVPLSSISCPAKKVVLTAVVYNTSVVTVGGSTVIAAQATRRGTPLYAGESETLEISDLNTVYLDAVVSGEGVTFVYMA